MRAAPSTRESTASIGLAESADFPVARQSIVRASKSASVRPSSVARSSSGRPLCSVVGSGTVVVGAGSGTARRRCGRRRRTARRFGRCGRCGRWERHGVGPWRRFGNSGRRRRGNRRGRGRRHGARRRSRTPRCGSGARTRSASQRGRRGVPLAVDTRGQRAAAEPCQRVQERGAALEVLDEVRGIPDGDVDRGHVEMVGRDVDIAGDGPVPARNQGAREWLCGQVGMR